MSYLSECTANEHCSGTADTCTEGRCTCGSRAQCWQSYYCVVGECKNCLIDEHCTGDTDTCISNSCHCGSNAKCSGKTDTCRKGICKCGENDECPRNEQCDSGKCRECVDESPDVTSSCDDVRDRGWCKLSQTCRKTCGCST